MAQAVEVQATATHTHTHTNLLIPTIICRLIVSEQKNSETKITHTV
jgi:hypothetical protein